MNKEGTLFIGVDAAATDSGLPAMAPIMVPPSKTFRRGRHQAVCETPVGCLKLPCAPRVVVRAVSCIACRARMWPSSGRLDFRAEKTDSTTRPLIEEV